MNEIWIAAGMVNLFTACIHLFAGHFDTVLPLLDSGLDTVVQGTLYACWHIVSLLLFWSSVIFLYIGVNPTRVGSQQIAMQLAVLYLLSGLLFMGLGFEYGLLTLPQWILILPISGLAWLGMSRP